MTVQRIDLNGSDWLFKDFVGEDWIWRHSEKPDTRDVRWWREGTVPGTVLHDLWKAGEVPDPYVERNSLLVEWVPERTWVYKKSFEIDASLKGQRIRLHFAGVDYEAQFFLNGKRIGQHTGMYTPAVFEVSDDLNYGETNLLAVVIEKAPDEQPQVSKTSYVRTHKSRMTYWWDFCPRMIHQGVWDDVYLEVTGDVRIEDVYVRPQLNDDFSQADVTVAVALSTRAVSDVWVETEIVQQGKQVAYSRKRQVMEHGRVDVRMEFPLEQPLLWQPNGSGEPHLYEARVRVGKTPGEWNATADADSGDASFQTLAEKRVTFGVRKVEFIQNDTPDETARPYTLAVNGVKTYIKGWNWVPMDVMYGVERPAKLERLLKLAQRAGVNMLRVWGGGLIEKDAFYDLCSRYGVMVWQEFIQSSSGIANKPSEDPAFLDMMVREAEQIIPRKRNHASLVLWCGGNELQDGDDRPLDDNEPVLGALHNVVKRLHPDALWLPTSPTGRCFLNSLDNLESDPLGQHDVHGPWEHQGLAKQYELYNKGTSLMHSEFGVEGMTHRKTLDYTIAPERQWPASKDNPVYFHRGAWWTNEPHVQECFGGGITDIAVLIRASQFLQKEGLRYAVESNRRRQWQNSGTLPWQFNEPYPNAYCTSALDYFTNPKPVYYGVAQAYRPASITASFETQAWAGRSKFHADVWALQDAGASPDSAKRQSTSCKAEWSLVGISGELYAQGEWQGDLSHGQPAKLGSVEAPLNSILDDLFVMNLQLSDQHGNPLASNRYLFSRTGNLSPMLVLSPTQLSVSKVSAGPEAWTVVVANESQVAALGFHMEDARPLGVEGYVYFSDNDVTILPGETKTFHVEWSGIPSQDRKLTLSSWNTEEQELT